LIRDLSNSWNTVTPERVKDTKLHNRRFTHGLEPS
jgi:hypothetical protein